MSAVTVFRRGISTSAVRQAGVWSGIKSAFKAKFFIGDHYDHYLPPQQDFRPAGWQELFAKNNIDPNASLRLPSPGSQPADFEIPRQHPETTFDISYHKRATIKTEDWKYETSLPPAPFQHSAHVPQPDWFYDDDRILFLRKTFLESGVVSMGLQHNHSRNEFVRDEIKTEPWEDYAVTNVVRDPNVPRL